MDLKEFIKKIRVEKGYNLETLGSKLGFSKGYLHKVETGLRPVSDKLFKSLIKFFPVYKDKITELYAKEKLSEDIVSNIFSHEELAGDVISDENRKKCLIFLNKLFKMSNFKFEILDIKENGNLADIAFIIEGISVEEYLSDLYNDYEILYDNLPDTLLAEQRSYLVNSYLDKLFANGMDALDQGYWKTKIKKGKMTVKINGSSWEIIDQMLFE